jgi:hypothetical protein
MVLSLKNLGAVCGVFLVFSPIAVHQSATAAPQLVTQKQAKAQNLQAHAVFKPILPTLQQKSQIRILLPKFVPGAEEENKLYAIIESATPKKYEILLGYSPDCNGGTACRLGELFAEAVTSKTPRLSGKRVSLAKGVVGYFVDFKCGANCSDATLSWRQQGVQYTIGLKAGDRASLIKMANSAIIP